MFWIMHFGIPLAHPASLSFVPTADAVPVIIAAMVFIVGLAGLSTRRTATTEGERESA